MKETVLLTLVVLTFNEELHIARCLESVKLLAGRMIVVDSFSTDRTLNIARSLGAEVFQHPFQNQARQFQWALDHCDIRSDWILRLDADEYLEDALQKELLDVLPTLPGRVTGVEMKRKVVFKGKWIRYGGYYPTIFLRAWRTGVGRIEQRLMDEHAVLAYGEIFTAKADFVDHNLKDITWWTAKHNDFTTRQMIDFLNLEYDFFTADKALDDTTKNQAGFKRFLRNKVFARAPLYVRGILYFILRYFLRLGFLDGRQGFVFHFLQGCWNWILVDAKIDEARAYIVEHGLEAFKMSLKSRYNIDLK